MTTFNKKYLATAMLVALTGMSVQARADDNGSVQNIFTDGYVDGDLRLYDFDRLYDILNIPNARALSLAALINAQTAAFGGGRQLA